MMVAAQHESEKGFTLVELMIVVAIIGVLAGLAVYGIARYLKHSKTAEATRSLGAIETGARSQFQRETAYGSDGLLYVHTFCPDTLATPATVPRAVKVAVPTSEWNQEGWTCLKFSINDPQFYSYQFKTNGATGTAATFTATAVGDLDGNMVNSTFELVGHGGALGDAIRDGMRVVNEDE